MSTDQLIIDQLVNWSTDQLIFFSRQRALARPFITYGGDIIIIIIIAAIIIIIIIIAVIIIMANFVIDVALRSFSPKPPLLFMVGICTSEHTCTFHAMNHESWSDHIFCLWCMCD